jgi:hypothetical protein
MTQDEIIDMARQVGIEAESDTLCRFGGWVKPFVAFANLVAAKALAQTQEPDDIASILACRNMLDAQPVPEVDRVIWPERTWVDVPDEEIKILWVQYRAALPRYLCFAKALLARSKEENT